MNCTKYSKSIGGTQQYGDCTTLHWLVSWYAVFFFYRTLSILEKKKNSWTTVMLTLQSPIRCTCLLLACPRYIVLCYHQHPFSCVCAPMSCIYVLQCLLCVGAPISGIWYCNASFLGSLLHTPIIFIFRRCSYVIPCSVSSFFFALRC